MHMYPESNGIGWIICGFLLTLAAPRSIETLGEAILNVSGQIDLPITLGTSHYLFNVDR